MGVIDASMFAVTKFVLNFAFFYFLPFDICTREVDESSVSYMICVVKMSL